MNTENFIDKEELKAYNLEIINKQINEINITLESHFRALDYYTEEIEKLIEGQLKTLNDNFRENIVKLEKMKDKLNKQKEKVNNK